MKFSPKFARYFFIILFAFGIALTAKNVADGLEVLSEPQVYRKDFLQEYILPLAWKEGANPYDSIDDLEKRLLSKAAHPVFWHPTPHPPALILPMYPLTLLSYPSAAKAWFFLELVLLILVSWKLSELFSKENTLMRFLFTASLIIGSQPAKQELVTGQLNTLMALIILCSWTLLQRKKYIASGALLGVCLSMKFFAWPLLCYFLICRRHKIVVAALGTFLLANMVALFAVGPQIFLNYFLEVAPNVSKLYMSDQHNFSIFTVGQRLFGGIYPIVKSGVTAQPMIYAPSFVYPVALIAAILLLTTSLFCAMRSKDPAVSFSIMLCASVLLSPVCWVHSLLLLTFCLVPLGNYLLAPHKQGSTSLLIVGSLALLSTGYELQNAAIGAEASVSFVESLVTWSPMIAVFVLMFACYRVQPVSRADL